MTQKFVIEKLSTFGFEYQAINIEILSKNESTLSIQYQMNQNTYQHCFKTHSCWPQKYSERCTNHRCTYKTSLTLIPTNSVQNTRVSVVPVPVARWFYLRDCNEVAANVAALLCRYSSLFFSDVCITCSLYMMYR